MSSITYLSPEAARAAVTAELDVVDAALARIGSVSTDLVGNAYRVEVAERVETQRRVLMGLTYRFFGEMADPPDADPGARRPKRGRVGKALRDRLATRLRLTPKEIKRRFRIATKLATRRSLTGEVLPPEFPVLAKAVAAGAVDDTHISAVLTGLRNLPRVASGHRDEAEEILVGHALVQDAEFVESVGKELAENLNPDDFFDDKDREAQSSLTLGPQRKDGMSRLSGWVNPQVRARLEAIGVKQRPRRKRRTEPDPVQPDAEPVETDAEPVEPDEAEPPADPQPDVPAAPEPEPKPAAEPEARDEPEPADAEPEPLVDPSDTRSSGQRFHDALNDALGAALESGTLGTHRGIPLTVIVTTTLQQIEQALRALVDPAVGMPPPARTAGGSVLPWRDLIRMAAGSVHYLSVFDEHTGRPLYLGRSERLASLDQRIVCHARDKGCTRPDCFTSGYDCEVMHVPGWYPDGVTNADTLYFGCPDDHGLADAGHAILTVTDTGRLAWQIGDEPPRVNAAHHPGELLRPPRKPSG